MRETRKFSKRWWRHQMETFFALLALCVGNSPVTGEFPHKGQWRGALIFSLIWAWINGWVNNRDVGDLRRHRAHYDVTLMNSGKRLWLETLCCAPASTMTLSFNCKTVASFSPLLLRQVLQTTKTDFDCFICLILISHNWIFTSILVLYV